MGGRLRSLQGEGAGAGRGGPAVQLARAVAPAAAKNSPHCLASPPPVCHRRAVPHEAPPGAAGPRAGRRAQPAGPMPRLGVGCAAPPPWGSFPLHRAGGAERSLPQWCTHPVPPRAPLARCCPSSHACPATELLDRASKLSRSRTAAAEAEAEAARQAEGLAALAVADFGWRPSALGAWRSCPALRHTCAWFCRLPPDCHARPHTADCSCPMVAAARQRREDAAWEQLAADIQESDAQQAAQSGTAGTAAAAAGGRVRQRGSPAAAAACAGQPPRQPPRQPGAGSRATGGHAAGCHGRWVLCG